MSEPAPPDLTVVHAHPDYDLDADLLEALARHVIDAEHYALHALSIVLADHDTVRQLNRAYLDHDYNTDVLSFDLRDADEPVVEGEVYVDLDTAAERHQEFDTTFTREVRRYIIHGLLHLLGYDDHTPEGKAAMHALEDRYLSATEPSA